MNHKYRMVRGGKVMMIFCGFGLFVGAFSILREPAMGNVVMFCLGLILASAAVFVYFKPLWGYNNESAVICMYKKKPSIELWKDVHRVYTHKYHHTTWIEFKSGRRILLGPEVTQSYIRTLRDVVTYIQKENTDANISPMTLRRISKPPKTAWG